MNIQCPNCHAAYDVPDSRLGARRLVRCGNCNHAWPVGDAEAPTDAAADAAPDRSSNAHPARQPEEEPAPLAPAIAAADDDRLAPTRPGTPRDGLLIGAWVASALLIISAATTAYLWRGDVSAAWPPASRILGMTPRTAAAAKANVPHTPPRQYTSTDAAMNSHARHD